MRTWLSRGILATFPCAMLIGANPGSAQTVPADAPPSTAPTNPGAVPAPGTGDDFQWLSLGAVAECRDGTFFHGKPDARACIEHGGIRRWLRGNEQDLIR